MDKDLLPLFIAGIIGFLSATLLEFIKDRLERRRAERLDSNNLQRIRAEQVSKFLCGEYNTQGKRPPPAWIRIVTVIGDARKYRFFRREKLELESADAKKYEYSTTRVQSDSNHPLTLSKILASDNESLKVKGSKHLLGLSNIIGRGRKCDIRILHDPTVSREHALIRYEDGQYFIYDLGSTNGTWLNDRQILNSGVPLQDGEFIRVGETILEFGMEDRQENFYDSVVVLIPPEFEIQQRGFSQRNNAVEIQQREPNHMEDEERPTGTYPLP